MTTYKVVRFYEDRDSEVIERGLTLQEAQAHCRRDDTHGTTSYGARWFDGYEEETDADILLGAIEAQAIDSENRKPKMYPNVLDNAIERMRREWRMGL